MKRIIICMDGTWQSLSQDKLTNIGILARSIAHKETRQDQSHVYQTVIYTQGVGTSIAGLGKRDFIGVALSNFNRLAGGAFGEGLEETILDTYLRLAFDYEKGDEIYIFGFSRGAFAARRLAGLINTAGIVSRLHTDRARDGFDLYYNRPHEGAPEDKKAEHVEAAKQFRMLYGKGDRNPDGTRRKTADVPPIQFLGVFDTVAQRGLGDVLASLTPWHDKNKFKFKNYRVSPNVVNARHAVAIDESRLGFPVLLWDGVDDDNSRFGRQAYAQRWFVGRHGDVGGGEGSKLAAAALKWMAEGARDAGLRFYATHGDDSSPLDDALRDEGMCFDADMSRTTFLDGLNPMNYPWRNRKVWYKRDKPQLQDLESYFDVTVMERIQADHLRPRYRPPGLGPFRGVMKNWRQAPPPT